MTRLGAMALVLALFGGAGCARGAAPQVVPDLDYGVRLAESEAVLDFHTRASDFYARLAQRRFNTRATYRDERLRAYFRSERAFADYYASLARALAEADFERNRPLRLDVVEFHFEGPGRARVEVRMVGEDARPLRWGEQILEREDRWERREGTWWLVPGKI